MTRVLIICGSGISSELLRDSAERSSEAYHAPITFEAASYSSAMEEAMTDADLVLVAPQVTYKYDQLKQLNSRVEKIPDDVYGWLNGENLVKFALSELASNE
ncbi:PTS sugar transporter subunit IIB [Secundilactobacillus kimchicus]|nr:hypothetical protein [Secundilactobacillus kimchicus]